MTFLGRGFSSLAALSFAAAGLVVGSAACGGLMADVGNDDRQDPSPRKDPQPRTEQVDGGDDGGTLPKTLEGSLDLRFTEVQAAGDIPTWLGSASPSLAAPFRVDLRRVGGAFVGTRSADVARGLEAVVTGRWSAPAAYAVSAEGDGLVLTGQGVAASALGAGLPTSTTDTWTRIVLPLDGEGHLTGAVRAEGRRTVWQGDAGWMGDLTGRGTVRVDDTAPEIRFDVDSPLAPAGKLLPWDAIGVTVAEPVEPTGVEEHTRLGGDHGDSLALRWLPGAPPAGTAWAGRTSFGGHLDDWTRAGSGEPWILRNVENLVKDPVGWVAAPRSQPLSILSVGPATNQVGFDDDILLTTPWGPQDLYGGGEAGTHDRRCESGGCLRLGPVSVSGCRGERAGFAALLNRLGGVELRYRVLVRMPHDGPDAPRLYTPAVTLEVASAGRPPLDVTAMAGAPVPHLATAVDGFDYGTSWTSLQVTAPEGMGPVGVAVALGGPHVPLGTCAGPPLPPAEVELLVERVKAVAVVTTR